MKKYFWILITLIWLIWTSVFATYEDFSQQLETMGVNSKTIESQNSISRYDLSRLLNMVECKDCIHPDQSMISKYVENFRSTFSKTPGKDFGDISFWGGLYNNVSYYYCVAYVGDNAYMRWYPKATSPVCGGQFCGIQNTTTAEFIQVVINILAKYIYKDIALNRKEVNTRVNKLKTDSYEAKNFNSDDRKMITEKIKTCDTTCALQNNNEVNLYLKYCMFNLTKCNMQEIGKIKQWFWPVAELNLLYSQSIIDIGQNQRSDINKNIDGKTVLETLFKLNGKVNCSFNNDYDCDGIPNTQDNCPNNYNPHQTDTNHDGIGDVCSDDIDGDGAKNPIGLVDDNGNINIKVLIGWTWKLDNCIFVPNTGQEDINNNGIWDACENIGNQIGIYINIDKLEGIAPLTTTFTAITKGNINEIDRDFWDGIQGNWASIIHTFLSPGMYNVQAVAKGNGSNAKAQVIVIIGWQVGDDKTLQTRASNIGGKSGTESELSTLSLGKFDEIERSFQKENSTSRKPANQSFKKIFKASGENPVIVKWYDNGKLAGISYFTIGIDGWRWAILRSNIANPEINQKILLDTKTYNINQEDIANVDRDFWDGIKKSDMALTIEYTYTKPWKRVITQTITLTDGKVLTNLITINVIDKTQLASYAMIMVPSTLIANIGQKIDFTTHIVGTLLKTPNEQIMEFGNGALQKKEGTEKLPSLFSYNYQKNNSLTPQDSLYIDQCTYLKNQITIAINGSDRCLDAYLQGTLRKTYKCDMNSDGIPDICDTDIDGDGVSNLLWLIKFENKDCSYIANPYVSDWRDNPKTNLDQEILAKHYQGVCSLDNAPFNINSDQLDLNQDGIGDAQILESGMNSSGNNNEAIDTDGDGIPDSQDLCPTIKGTINNNGCPEIDAELWCNNDQQGINPLIGITNDNIIVDPAQCNQCPCQYGDFSSDLTNNDQVRAILRDNKKTIQYKFSLPWIVDFQ